MLEARESWLLYKVCERVTAVYEDGVESGKEKWNLHLIVAARRGRGEIGLVCVPQMTPVKAKRSFGMKPSMSVWCSIIAQQKGLRCSGICSQGGNSCPGWSSLGSQRGKAQARDKAEEVIHLHVCQMLKGDGYLKITCKASMAAEFRILPCLAQFPLADPPATVENEVCQALFGWRDCVECTNKGGCMVIGCPWKRKAQLSHYLQFYFDTTGWSTPTDLSEQRYALGSHHDLLAIIRLINDKPNHPRRKLMVDHFSAYGYPQPALADQKRAFDLAITLIAMISCSECNPYCRRLDPMLAPVDWDEGDSAYEFVKSKISMATECSQPSSMPQTMPRLSVSKIQKAGIELHGTENLRRHLLYDPEAKTLQIFHFASFLEEQLRQMSLDTTTSQSVYHPILLLV